LPGASGSSALKRHLRGIQLCQRRQRRLMGQQR
jgi:hypothetical protein